MTAEQLASVAGLLADRTRAAICLALLDGRAWTVSELARHAGVAPSTASEHVSKLVNGAILVSVYQGRHRYVRLADAGVAQLVEDLGTLAGPSPTGVRSLRGVRAAGALARARTCYDHLAGRLGVEVTEAMTRSGLLDQAGGFALTSAGLGWLADRLDVDVAALTAARRPIARPCLDWTERRPHLGGGAGAAVCAAFFARGWIARTGSTRAVAVTASGELALRQLCGINLINVA